MKHILWRIIVALLVVGIANYMVGGWQALVIYAMLLLAVGAFLFAAWQLAKNNIFYTFVGRGKIKTIDRGKDNVIRVLSNLSDHHVENMKIEEGKPNKSLLEKHLGMFWIGIPPAEVHRFSFVHERVNPRIGKDTPSSEWVTRDKDAQSTDELLWEIPHSYLISGVELSDGFKVDVLFSIRSRVVDPVTALYLREGKFIDYMAQYVEAGVTGKLRTLKIEELRGIVKEGELNNSPQSENSRFSKSIVELIDPPGIETGLNEATGLTVIAGFIARWDASDKEQEKALAAVKLADLKGDAEVRAAEKAADAAKKLASGQMAGLETILEIIKKNTPGISDEQALREANALAMVTKLTDPKSPITVLGAGINIGVNQERK